MKKLTTLLIIGMMLTQLHAQQDPTTNASEQDVITNAEAVQSEEDISQDNTDAAEETSESTPLNEDENENSIIVLDDFQSKTIDSKLSEQIDPTPSTDEEKVQFPLINNEEENESAIVVLDDFQSIQPLEKKRSFLSFLSTLFKKKKKKDTNIMTTMR